MLDLTTRAAGWKRPCVLGFTFWMVLTGAARLRAVWGTLPYGQHVDEVHLTTTALRIVQTGDLNPHFFKYPSLPIYWTALCLKAAAALSRSAPSALTLAVRGAPYEPTAGYATTRLTFALLSVATVALVGLLARRLFRSDLALVAAPILLSASRVFQVSGATYVNVDVATAFFVTSCLVASISAWDRDSVSRSALLPGVLCGMAAACKYTGGIVLVPAALAIALGQDRRRPAKLAVLGAVAALTFLACVPYSVLDFRQFVQDVKWEMHHYKTGHLHYDGPTGLPQLAFYLRELAGDYGTAVMALAALGAGLGLYRAPRTAAMVLVLPVAILAHMSTNRVHFIRTVLPVFVMLPVFAAGGVAALAEGARALLSRTMPSAASRWPLLVVGPAAGALALALALSRMSVWLFLDRNIPRDTRNVAGDWLRARKDGGKVLVARELHFSSRSLAGLTFREATPFLADLPSLVRPGSHAYVVFPVWKAPPGPSWPLGPRAPLDPFGPALSRVRASPALLLPGAAAWSPVPSLGISAPSPALVIAEIR